MSLSAPDFAGITRRKQTADWTLLLHLCKSTVFARVEIGLARLTPGMNKNAKFLNRLLKKNGYVLTGLDRLLIKNGPHVGDNIAIDSNSSNPVTTKTTQRFEQDITAIEHIKLNL